MVGKLSGNLSSWRKRKASRRPRNLARKRNASIRAQKMLIISPVELAKKVWELLARENLAKYSPLLR